MKIIARVALLTVPVVTAATAVAVFVVPAAPASASAPPDITPVKVAATVIGEGHAVYVRGTDARLYWRTVEHFTAPGYSTSWRALPGGTVSSGPDAAQVDPDSVVLAAKANDLSLLVRQQDGTSFGAWQNLGGKITTAPALALSSATGRLYAFARGGDGAAWYRVRETSGTWAPWASIGGILTAAPDPVLLPNETSSLRVNVRGGNGSLYMRTHDESLPWTAPWQGPFEVPLNSAASSPTQAGGIYTKSYYRGANRHVLIGFPSFDDLGGIVTSAPEASMDDRVIAAVGTNRALYARINGAPWVSLGGIAA
jgi:hypothetical protein